VEPGVRAQLRGDIDASLPRGERALALARELGLVELSARSLSAIAYAQTWQVQGETAEARAAEARALYAGLGNRAMEADCLAVISEAQIMLGQPRAGLATARAAYAISCDIENTWGQAHSAGKIGYALLEIGEYTEALQIAQAGLAAARTNELTALVAFNLRLVGNIYRALLALDAARAAHGEALALSASLGTRLFAQIIAAELCADCVLADDWAEASTYAHQTLATGHASSIYAGLTRWHMTEALLRAGANAVATEDVRRFGEGVGDNRRYRIAYLRALAVLARWEGRAGQAIAHLEAANTLAEDIGLPGEQWQILAALGEMYRAAGEADMRRQALTRTAEIVQVLAANIADPDLRTEFLSQAQLRYMAIFCPSSRLPSL
jgi:tetratricopeptide (TPR) repeat protein